MASAKPTKRKSTRPKLIKDSGWMGTDDGYEREKNTDFIVSSGIGDWSIKFKTGCVAEYVVVDINK